MTERLLIKRMHPDARLPVRGTPDSAGLDIFACNDKLVTFDTLERVIIPTGLAMRPPLETYIRAAPRSGISWNGGIHVMAGVIDIDFTGEVGIMLINLSREPFRVEKGDRIAQIVLERISMANSEWVDELPATIRGGEGYGSTGV